MNKNPLSFILLLALLMTAGPASAGEVVGRYSGSGSGETGEFEVSAPWILDWVINGDFPQMNAIEVSLIDAASGTHQGYVLKTKEIGNGVRLFDQSGRYRLKVDSAMMRWNFKIEQLTREEAELYTPVQRESMMDSR
jgi:hypothetical protein